MNPTMNGCCCVCGHTGFAEALATCTKCRISQEHLYCMRYFQREQPTEWHCQDCEQEKETILPSCDTREDLTAASTLKTSSKLHKFDRLFAGPSSSNAGSKKVLPKWQKFPNNARVKFISVAEASKLPSGSKKPDQALAKTTGKFASPLKKMHSIQHTNDTRTDTRAETQLKKAFSTPSLSFFSGSKTKSGNFEAQANKDKQIQNIQPGNRLSDFADSETAKAKVELVMKKASPRPKSPNTSTIGARRSFGDVYTNIQHESSEAEKDNQENEENNRVPARDASWKGSFKMLSAECNNGLCSDIQGCPPSKVLKKVYETSNRMPEILQFQLIPRENLWNNIFRDRCPDFDDVGLFFFPIENKRCDNYFKWIEFIGKNDLVMRMSMQSVELLVFSSAHLHRKHQTWDRAHFFWGLFRVENLRLSMADNRNIPEPCPLHEAWNCSCEGDDSQVADMEIDMEAGTAVGVLDIVKKRRSLEDLSGAAREPFITANTNITSPVGTFGGEREATVTTASNNSPDIPPGFEPQKKKITIASNIPSPFFREGAY